MWGKYDGPPATLGSSARAQVWLVVWCEAEGCRLREHVYIPPDDIAAHAERFGENMTLLDFEKRLKCSGCGGKDVDMIVSGPPQKVCGSYPPPSTIEVGHGSGIKTEPPPPWPGRRRSRRRSPSIG